MRRARINGQGKVGDLFSRAHTRGRPRGQPDLATRQSSCYCRLMANRDTTQEFGWQHAEDIVRDLRRAVAERNEFALCEHTEELRSELARIREPLTFAKVQEEFLARIDAGQWISPFELFKNRPLSNEQWSRVYHALKAAAQQWWTEGAIERHLQSVNGQTFYIYGPPSKKAVAAA